MNEPTTTTIEINGVKLEVDLRTAKRIDNIKVGSRVKILQKTRVKILQKTYGGHDVLHGVVIGFEPFEKLPTIIVAAAKLEYNSAKIEFIYYNAKSECEMVLANDADEADIDKNNFLAQIDRAVTQKEEEIKELKLRRQYFLDKFGCYWTQVAKAE